MHRIGVVIIAMMLTACGAVREHLSGSGRLAPKSDNTTTDVAPAPQLDAPAPPGGSDSSGRGTDRRPVIDPRDDRFVPIETFLAARGEIPPRLMATSARFEFRSNIEGARFECRFVGDAAFSPCPQGNQIEYARLRHGQQAAVFVRARGPSGRVDLSPLQIGFVVDLVAGTPLDGDAAGFGGRMMAPLEVSQIPLAEEAPPAAGDATPVDRQVLVGHWYAVSVPWTMTMTSYASSVTYSGQLRTLRALGPEAAGSLGATGAGCTKTFERQVVGPAGRPYCEGTPTRAESLADSDRPMPWNHAELVSGSGDERLLVSAFARSSDNQDPAEGRLQLAQLCNGNPTAGQITIPLLARFFAGERSGEVFRFCQFRAGDGAWWWLGVFTSELSPEAGSLQVIYAIESARGIGSGNEFAARASQILPRVIVPIAPTNRD